MFSLPLEFVASSLQYSVSVTTLTISGDGEITKEFVRSTGDYQSYTQIIINDGPVSINELAFEDLLNVVSYQLPASLTTISSTAFRFNYHLSTFIFPNGNEYFEVDEQGALYTKGRTELIRVPPTLTEFIIPNTVTKLCEQSIQASSLQTLNIPSSTETIENGFIFDSSISSLTFSKPAKIKEFKDSAFAYTKIKEIEIPNSVQYLKTACFYQSSNITTITFEENSRLETIESNAFYQTPLQQITFPNKLLSIGEYSFYGCTLLAAVHFSSSINYIGINAFYGCSSISTITIDQNPNYIVENGVLYDQGKANMILVANTLKSLTIPSTLQSICKLSIQICSSLTDVQVEEGSYSFYAENGILYSFDQTKAFACCGGMTGVNVLSTVTFLSDYCFYQCSKLDSITGLGGTQLTTIGSYCFASISISELDLPSTLQYIYDYAFHNVTIQNLNFQPSNLKLVSYYAFYYAKINEFSFGPMINSLNSFAFEFSEVSKITFDDSCPLTTISTFAFAYCYQLNSVTIPKSIETIDSYAFYYSNNIKYLIFAHESKLKLINNNAFQQCSIVSIQFPKSLITISNYAFSYCQELISISFDELETTGTPQLKTLSPSSFISCSKLTNVRLPSSLENIDYSVFSMCTSLETFDLSEENQFLSVHDGLIFNKDGDTLKLVPAGRKNVTVANTVSTFGSNAFYNCINLQTCIFESDSNLRIIKENTFYNCFSLIEVTIPDSVETIENNAFYNCSKLSNVSFPDNSHLSSIGSNTFHGCESLASIIFGLNASLQTIGENSFADCKKLSIITIPNSVKEIGSNCFSGCVSLQSVIFSPQSSLRKLNSNTFSNCISLETFTFPDSIEIISSGIFSNCNNLKKLQFEESTKNIVFDPYCLSGLRIEEIVIPDSCSIKAIKSNAFQNSKIKHINLPRVEKIESSAFADCSSLETFSIKDISYETPPSSPFLLFETGCFENCNVLSTVSLPKVQSLFYSISNFCFKNCKSLTGFMFNQVSQIGSNSFENCELITNIDFSQIEEFGSSAFKGCIGITSLNFDNCPATKLSESCFEGCSSIVSISFFNSQLTEIDSKCFKDCTSLHIKTLPRNIVRIGNMAFFNSSLNGQFIISENIQQIGARAFLNTYIKRVIYCGNNQIPSTEPAFPVDVYVMTNYQYSEIAGVKALKKLTSNCVYIPSESHKIHFSHFIFCFAIILIHSRY